MYRHMLIAAAALTVLAGPALAVDGVRVHPRSEPNLLPFALQRQIDPMTTASVPGASAPERKAGKVFVHPRSEQDLLPFELERGSSLF